MTLLVLGVSHRTAPLRVLDRLGLTQDESDNLAADLSACDVVSEAIVLATCNRVEVYADVTRFHSAVAAVTDSLAKWTGADRHSLVEHSYVHFDSAAVAHLFAVAAGLDSMVVGESQILGQVRSSLGRAQEAGTAGRELNVVVQQALRVGKRVHSETGIDRSGVSVVSVALDAAVGVVGSGSPAGRRVLVVGAGSMGALTVSTLVARGVTDVVVTSRTRDAAERIVRSLPESRVADLSSLSDELAAADVAVFCTGAQDTLVDAALVRSARAAAEDPDRPLVIIDLALPHDVDPEVGSVPGVTRIDLAALAALPATAASEADMRAAREIVAREVEAHLTEVAAQQVEPILISLRAHAGGVLDAEMARLRLRLANLDDTAMAEVERAMRRSMAALLHNPTVRMKQLAAQPGGDRYAEALTALFDLDPSLPASVLDPTPEVAPGSGGGPG